MPLDSSCALGNQIGPLLDAYCMRLRNLPDFLNPTSTTKLLRQNSLPVWAVSLFTVPSTALQIRLYLLPLFLMAATVVHPSCATFHISETAFKVFSHSDLPPFSLTLKFSDQSTLAMF